MLQLDGPATATGLGETTGTTSWHLRQLAGHGLTERGTKRERWWKASHDGTDLHIEDFRGDEESVGALSACLHEIASGVYRRLTRFLAAVLVGLMPALTAFNLLALWALVLLTASLGESSGDHVGGAVA